MMLSPLCAALLLPAVMATNNEAGCIANTGARCISSCHDWRGPAYCKYSRCFCNEGACAGHDDICHTEKKHMTNLVGDQKFRIRNARWPEFLLYASTHGPLTAKRMRSFEYKQFQWTLKEPPGLGDNTSFRAPSWLVFSHNWPDAVMFISQRVTCSSSYSEVPAGPGLDLGGNNSNFTNTSNMSTEQIEDHLLDPENNLTLPQGWEWEAEPEVLELSADKVDDPQHRPNVELETPPERRLSGRRRTYGGHTNCKMTRSPITRYVQGTTWGLGTDPPMHWLLTKFEKPPLVFQQEYPDAQLVMMKNSQNSYLYMGQYGVYGFAGWGTRGTAEDPGAGGYWFLDPPMPDELYARLPTYTGRTCWLNCGTVAQIVRYVDYAPPSQLSVLVGLLAAFTTLARSFA